MHFTNFLLQPVINCSRRRVCSLFLFQAQPTAVALWSHWHFLVRLTHELHLRIGPALTINISNLKAKRRHSEQFQELPFSQKIYIFYYKVKKLHFSLLVLYEDYYNWSLLSLFYTYFSQYMADDEKMGEAIAIIISCICIWKCRFATKWGQKMWKACAPQKMRGVL